MKITRKIPEIMNLPPQIADIKQRLTADLQKINAHFDKGYSILEHKSFVVATEDGFYAVGTSDHNLATVHFYPVFPQKFTEAQADDLVTNFKAVNGHGPLTWLKMTEDDYLKLKKSDLEFTLAQLTLN